MNGIRNLSELLRNMNPVLHPESMAFCACEQIPESAVGHFREHEGTTVILPVSEAQRLRLEVRFRAAWITVTVESDLEAIGFLAEVTRGLAESGIPCNVLSAIHHDHLFVPVNLAGSAMNTLRRLQANRAETSP